MVSSGRSRHLVVRSVRAGIAAAVMAVGVSACGGGGSELSELAQLGKSTSTSNGCASCHGANGQGGVGPTWIDLAGSVRELDDGSTVVADEAYLLRSILEPGVEVVAGYSIRMPMNGLSDAEAANVVTYIQELTSDEPE